MKNFIYILILVFFTSFNSVEHVLPDGNYSVTFDKEYEGEGFDCKIQNDKFYLIRKDKTEIFDVIWITEKKFRVVGFLEPKDPSEAPPVDRNSYGYYEVEKIDENNYSYKVKMVGDDYVLLAGKFIRKK